MSKKIIFVLLFIIIVGGFFSFWFYRERIFSKEVLKLEILGPESAKIGEEIEYTVKYKNNGNFVLEKPKLIFEVPEHSLMEDEKTRFTKDLKDIYPGDEDFVKFKTRLLGKENDLRVSHAWLSYAPKNLTARYESETTFTTKIDTVPITLDFDLPSKAEKGKEIQYSINYFSNIDYPLENLSIKVDSVNGFEFESSEPSSLDKSEWKIPTLNKAQGARIKIKGRITAEPGEHLNFEAKLGMWQDGEFVLIKEATKDVEVIEPLLFISQQINGSSSYVASPGDQLHYEIFFRNIGSTPFENLFILTRIEGSALDLSTIQSQDGEVRPNDNLIVWDFKQIPELRHLDTQQEGKVEFDVKLKDNWVPSDSEKNNTFIKNKVNISQISQEFQTKVNSKLEISQKGFYSTQADIVNSGPIPPVATQATTYTITWQIKNYFNDVKNVKVRATLPQGVTLTGRISPDSETAKFSLDSASREIIWSVGDLAAGTGVTGPLPSLSFQVSLIPSPFQRGRTAGLIDQVSISGEDQFTGTIITAKSPAVDTNLPDDPSNSGKGIVQ